MKKYVCKECKFSSNNKTDYSRHLSSNKHFLKNIKKQNFAGTLQELCSISQDETEDKTKKSSNSHKCPYCGDSFTRRRNMKIHQGKCSVRIIKEKDRAIKKTKKRQKQDRRRHRRELKMKDELLSKYKEDIHYFKQLLLVSTETENKNMNSYRYINKTFKDTDPLQKLTYKKFSSVNKIQFIDNNRSRREQLAYDVMHAYRHDIIDKYFGSVIVEIYKDLDPSKQSVWIVDKSRLKYIIREVDEDNNVRWIVDSNGVKTSKLLIDPLLKEIKKSLKQFRKKHCTVKKGHVYDHDEQQKIMRNGITIHNILSDIEDGKISKGILKYISTFFGVDIPAIETALECKIQEMNKINKHFDLHSESDIDTGGKSESESGPNGSKNDEDDDKFK